MTNNLPTTPGPYWFREKDGDEWKYGEVYRGHSGDLYWETMAIGGKPLDHMQGQWAKAHKPDDVEDLAKCRDELKNIAEASPEKWEMPIDEFLTEYWQWTQNRVRHTLMNACEPVTIYRKEKE